MPADVSWDGREFPYRAPRDLRLPEAIALMQKVDDGKFVEDMSSVLDFLAAEPKVDGSRIAVTGFCMGGRLSFLSACTLGDRISAAAPFYGGGIAGPASVFSAESNPASKFSSSCRRCKEARR